MNPIFYLIQVVDKLESQLGYTVYRREGDILIIGDSFKVELWTNNMPDRDAIAATAMLNGLLGV